MTKSVRSQVSRYWHREGLSQAILEALIASNKKLDRLTIDDLALLDQFHAGGKAATEQLALLAQLRPEANVLDVGGGLGGPARTLATTFDSYVTVLDIAEGYVSAGAMLTACLNLEYKVAHLVGDALTLPFRAESFNVVWTQNSGMNIEDKQRLYEEFHRVLSVGGKLVFQEPMGVRGRAPFFPVMWAADSSSSFLKPPAEMRAVIEAAGFKICTWTELEFNSPACQCAPAMPSCTIQELVMKDALASIVLVERLNLEQSRIVNIRGVCERI